MLLTVTRTEEGGRLLGFSASTVLSFGAALFFVVVVSHINLRASLAARGLVYLELFYFVMYAAILVVGVNSLLVASPNRVPLIHYRDNLIVRLLYWPVILAILLVMTIITFG